MSMSRLSILALLGGVFVVPAPASAALKVIATTSDLASLAAEVGGDKISVDSIAKGYQDPHFVEAKPSFVFKLNSADLLIAVGRELEIGWLPPLITQARNPKVQPGGAGYLDASLTVRILDMPTGQITRAMGDVHPSGNPHYWLDPDNGKRIAKAIEGKLSAMDAANAAYFRQREGDFERRLDAADARWKAALAPYKGVKVVTYHRSWPNFVDHFGFDVIGYVEPKPGIPPSPSHTLDLIQEMKRQNVKIILVEPYFDLKTPNSIAQNTGGQVVVLAPSVGAEKEITDYIKLFDYDVDTLLAAFKAAGVK
jgi:zinc/manganese transport system substrate-binding protein